MPIDPTVSEWLNLVIRWIHVFAGILWVGTTYYFTWLDARLNEEEKSATPDRPAQIWMVHSGGFYVVERRKIQDDLTRKLHWFRFEALFTWVSGMALLALVYYNSSGMVDVDVMNISHQFAVLIGFGVIVGGWIVYDLLWLSPLKKHELLGAAISYALIVAITFLLMQVLSGRAAYIHLGAMFGTIMTANVWIRILPGQHKMLAAINEGRAPDMALAARAKQRSKHNTFIVVPVVFTMISSHFAAATYGDRYNWVILSVLVLIGWGAAKIVRRG